MVKVISTSGAFCDNYLGDEACDGATFDRTDGLTHEERLTYQAYEAYRRECVARRMAASGRFVRQATIGKRINK